MNVRAVFNGDKAEDLAAFIADQRPSMKGFRRVVVNSDSARIIDLNRDELHFPGITIRRPIRMDIANFGAPRAMRGDTTESCNIP